MHQFGDSDLDQSGNVSRAEFVALVEKAASFPATGSVIVSDELWESFDLNDDGFLDAKEFHDVSHLMSLRSLYVEPILVFPAIQVKHDYDFVTTQHVEDAVPGDHSEDSRAQVFSRACENFVLVRQRDGVIPYNSTGWNLWYKNITAGGVDPLALPSCHSLRQSAFSAINVGPLTDTYVVPLLSSKSGTNAIFVDPDAMKEHDKVNDTAVDLYDRIVRKGLDLTLTSSFRFPDVVHVFDMMKSLEGMETRTDDEGNFFGDDDMTHLMSDYAEVSVKRVAAVHKGVTEENFQDDTAVIVKGAILFPHALTDDSDCGLFGAKLSVYEEGASGEPETHLTDTEGWFEFSLTRGKTYTVLAEFPGHEICYSGGTMLLATSRQICDGVNPYVVLKRVTSSQFIFFTDTTTANIDLGLYQGECDARYEQATFRLTPLNGCHAPVYVTDTDIKAWYLPDTVNKQNKERIPSVENVPNAKRWNYAAMDYSVELISGPDMSKLDHKRVAKYPNADCSVDTLDIAQYFRARGTKERIAPLLTETTWWEIRYKYHGYVCAEIQDLTQIGADETCYNESSKEDGRIKFDHLLGTSTYFTEMGKQFDDFTKLKAKVFEVHLSDAKADTNVTMCSILSSRDVGVHSVVKLRQDVTDKEENECHTDRDGGTLCDFDVTSDEEGFLLFPPLEETASPSNTRKIVAGKPNLAGTHRRVVQITVLRNDGLRVVSATSSRPLITLGSRPRGEDEYGAYSDDVFFATVPLDGLVYSVVHDPPGGNSYAELLLGTKVTMSTELTTDRGASVSRVHSGGGGIALDSKSSFGFNAGWVAEASLSFDMPLLKLDIEGTHSESGPDFSTTQTSADGWDMTATVDRVIRTSTDVGIPGRQGDVILGGGVELQYKLADVLDLSNVDANGNATSSGLPCLITSTSVTWLPRRPTSYVFGVHAIESQVIPNLIQLRDAVKSSQRENTDSSGMPASLGPWDVYLQAKLEAWRRTLLWSAPKVYKMAQGSEYTKNYAAFTQMTEPIMGANSLVGRTATPLMNTYTESVNQTFGTLKSDLEEGWKSMKNVQPNIFGVQMWDTDDAGSEINRLSPYLEDSNPTSGGGDKYVWSSRFTDALSPKFLERFSVNSNLQTSLAMNDFAVNDTRRTMPWCDRDKCQSFNKESRLDETSRDPSIVSGSDYARVYGSFTGSVGPTGLSSNDPSAPTEDVILLSFSGGGPTTEYIYSTNEEVADAYYAINMNLDATAENSFAMAVSVLVAKGQYSKGSAFSKSFSRNLAFSWSHYEHMSAMFALGDPEHGDKFVLHVASDKRFGTPVFMTQGGRSKCPGEELTMFREAGLTISRNVHVSGATMNMNLNPGDRAIVDLKIINNSPYKEKQSVGLRLFDGVADCMERIIAAAYKAADLQPSSGDAVKTIVEETAKSSECIASDSDEVKHMAREATAGAALTPTDASAVAYRVSKSTQNATQAGTMMRNMEFTINGVNLWAFGEVLPLKRIAGERLETQHVVRETNIVMSISRDVAVFESKYIGISLVSLCESMLESHMYRPIISSSVSLGPMTWSRHCPKVAFSETTMAREDSYFTKKADSADTFLNLTVINPDRFNLWPTGNDATNNPSLVNEHLKYVRLQYRSVKGGEWIAAKDTKAPASESFKANLLCDNSRTQCRFDWDLSNFGYDKLLSGYKDGAYELRLKSYCAGGHSVAEAAVHEYVSDQILTLKVDTKNPLVRDLKYTESLSTQEVSFTEDVDCTSAEMVVQRRDNETTPWPDALPRRELHDFETRCFADKWVLKFPPSASGYYRVKLRGIQDSATNDAEDVLFEAPVRVAAAKKSASSRLGAPEFQFSDAGGVAAGYERVAVHAIGLFCACCVLLAVAVRTRRLVEDPSAEGTSSLEKEMLLPRARIDTRDGPMYGSSI